MMMGIVLNCGAGLVLALTWLFAAQVYPRLPAQVPLHFGWRGQPDGWGRRSAIWLLPAIAGIEFAAILAGSLMKAPETLQVFLALINLETMLLFHWLLRQQARVALGQAQRLGGAVWVFTALLLFTALGLAAYSRQPVVQPPAGSSALVRRTVIHPAGLHPPAHVPASPRTLPGAGNPAHASG